MEMRRPERGGQLLDAAAGPRQSDSR